MYRPTSIKQVLGGVEGAGTTDTHAIRQASERRKRRAS
jgi:hypothetical protein